MVFAENELLKEACEAAEKAQDDLKKKSAITEVFDMVFIFLLNSLSLTHCANLFGGNFFYTEEIFSDLMFFFALRIKCRSCRDSCLLKLRKMKNTPLRWSN